MSLDIEQLNALSENDARSAFMQCCTASRWVELMVESRPYTDAAACQEIALSHWANMSEGDYLEAFEGHPKIGDLNSLRGKYRNTKGLASAEQSAVSKADEVTITRLAESNTDYEAQNGFIFIVCASGKSAADMMSILEARLKNSRTEELSIAASEQAKITAIRIDKLLSS